jgi:hypothetical protein
MPHRFLPKNARRVAIVGLAKNVGKTTALNALLEGLATGGATVGLMSVGVDGEAFDAIGGHAKPPVSVARGTLVCTSEASLRYVETPHDVLMTTRIRSTLGEVLVVRTNRPGDVVLSGVRHRGDVKVLTEKLFGLGVTQVVIDGAFDRIAAASPEASDAVIAATGMEVAETVGEVVDLTAAWVRRLHTPRWQGSEPLEQLCVRRGNGWEECTKTLIEAPLLGPPGSAIFAPGLVSDAGLHNAARSLVEGGTLICADATRVLASRRALEAFGRARKLRVLVPLTVAVVCANPSSVSGRRAGASELVSALGHALPSVPVVDVVSGAESLPC